MPLNEFTDIATEDVAAWRPSELLDRGRERRINGRFDDQGGSSSEPQREHWNACLCCKTRLLDCPAVGRAAHNHRDVWYLADCVNEDA